MRSTTPPRARSLISVSPTMWRPPREKSAPPGCPRPSPRASRGPGDMDLSRLAPGETIDGFRLEAPLKPGGMANLWRVTHPDHAMPLVMKLPFVQPGENPIAIIGFEVESMILPRVTGEPL